MKAVKQFPQTHCPLCQKPLGPPALTGLRSLDGKVFRIHKACRR